MTVEQLAMKVIQLEQVALKLHDTKTQCKEMIRQNITDIDSFSSIADGYMAAIEELKEIIRLSRDAILSFNEKILSLESSIMTHLREEEGLVAATNQKIIDVNIAKIKKLMNLLKKCLGDTEQKKNLIKARIKQLSVEKF
jgi:hypothetical protein